MKFGHRFQAVIEATHPRVADQVRARPRRGGCSTPRVLTSRRGGGTPQATFKTFYYLENVESLNYEQFHERSAS